MRVRPTPVIALAIFAAYIVLVSAIWFLLDVDYSTIGLSTESAVEGIVIPVGAGAVLLAAAATWLGWWRPALSEARRSEPGWAVAVPVLLVVLVVMGLLSVDFGADVGSLLPLIALGTLLVGFSEEMLTRGLGLVGFRGGVSERMAWFWTSLLFALLHGINVVFGASLGSTVQQITFAFVVGSALYVTRRVLGTLLVPMLLHAAWDFGTIGTEATDGTPGLLGGLLLYPLALVTFFAVWKVTSADRAPAPVTTEPTTA
ncbi:MAG TPA: CPBP family intramembrane glutamic endopeptidase [Jiangellales bacterium]|nr:CPBP family intramembrane glutamic endopeptidase [Jiangellales bacterium]